MNFRQRNALLNWILVIATSMTGGLLFSQFGYGILGCTLGAALGIQLRFNPPGEA